MEEIDENQSVPTNESTNMLEPDQWDAVLSRITGTIYRGTERISSNTLLNLLEVGPDPVLRQRVAKRTDCTIRRCDMPTRELVKLHDAAGRLAVEWSIPPEDAMQIIRGILQGGECFVRGRRPGEMGLRDISREISREFGSTFPPAFLFSREFIDVEIDWNDLLKLGRDLVPPWLEYLVEAAEARAADDETKAINRLAEKLATDPNMKFDDAWKACKKAFPALSTRGVRSHVWPQARTAAGLERRAPPGRKSKTKIQHA
jgi:hypothetical protein